MYFTLTKRSVYRNTLFIITAVLFFSCQKEFSIDNGNAVPLPDLKTKISSSVSGFVTDENDAAVKGATVQFGTSTITTDKYGYFEMKNVQVVKDAAVVTVNKPGYFKGIKTYIAKEGKAAFFRIKLIPKTNVGSISGATGGTVALANGLSIVLPAGAVVNAATNTTYTGTVSVAAFWINPEAADLDKIMPGDLRGINTEGVIKLLQTYGMAAVELTGVSGELLQIAGGKKATLTLAIPASLSANAPASIPLWYFNETNGLWKEEGSAVKTGNSYVGEVSHFSYWNCDFPFPNAVQFDCTLVDVNGNPIPGLDVWINYPNGQITGCHGTTNANGYAGGAIPANSQLVLAVYNYVNGCSNIPIYTQPFTTTNSNISLGIVTVTNNVNSATITGTLSDCNGQPVTNGYIMMYLGNHYTRYDANSNGSFNFSTFICGSNNIATFIGGDVTNLQEGPLTNVTLQTGQNNIGNLVACGTSTPEFVNYTINGSPVSIIPPAGSIYQEADSMNTNSMLVSAYENNLSFITMGINTQSIATGSIQDLNRFTSNQTGQTTIPAPIQVNITEYGSVNQFISGNFSGTVIGTAAPNNSYTVTCNFRVRRHF